MTNGMGFSPDATLLYHCDSTTKAVWAYDVTADRRLKDRRVFATLPEGWPDGMAVDVEGGVWVAVVRYGEVVRFKANGTMERRIKMPSLMVTSLCFGGADMMDLYVVTADNTEDASRKGTIFRMRADVPGLARAKGTVLSAKAQLILAVEETLIEGDPDGSTGGTAGARLHDEVEQDEGRETLRVARQQGSLAIRAAGVHRHLNQGIVQRA